MRFRSSLLCKAIAVAASCISVKWADAAPSLPSEQIVQQLVYEYIHTNGGYGSTEQKQMLRKQFESIYYFDTPSDRIRYKNGAASKTMPSLEGGPRFFDDDDISYFPGSKLFHPKDILVVPPPVNLSDDAEPVAVVFIPDWSPGGNHNYNGPGLFRFVHSEGEWLIHFDTYKPTPRESQDDPIFYIVLQEQGVQAERAKLANASGEGLRLLRRQYFDTARYIIAGNQYAIERDVGMTNTKTRFSTITKERVAAQVDNFNKMLNLSSNDFKNRVLSELDTKLEVLAKNYKSRE